MSVRKGGQIIAGAEETKFVSGHTIGEIFYTSRLTPQISGAVDADGKIYPVAAFRGKESVPTLLAKGELDYVSFAEYESIVSTNGSCRAWGWDNGDTFRVPTVKALLLTKEQAAVVGNGMTVGWTNGTNNFGVGGFYGTGGSQSTGNYGLPVGSSSVSANISVLKTVGLTTDPEKSGIVANLDVIEYRAMVQISTSVQEDATQLKEYKFNNPHFFGESKWTDVEPNNASWLLSNAQWNSKSVYPDYYDWLVGQYNNPTMLRIESNVIKVGSVTDNNGILTGFTTSSFARIPSFRPLSYIWEQHWKIITGSDVTTTQYFSGEGQVYDHTKPAIGIANSAFRIYLSSNGTSWDIAAAVNGGSVNANTIYYVKYGWDGSTYYVDYSTDDKVFSRAITINSSTPVVDNSLDSCVGISWITEPFLGSVDLNESYININGQRWWTGRKGNVIKTGEASVYPDYDFVINQNDQTFRLPLKTKLASGSAVVGNGKTLGLTNGSYEYGLTFQGTNAGGNTGALRAVYNDAGKDVGVGGTYGSLPAMQDVMGVSTDPEKSGIETSSNGLKLYFYVGDTVQDASLINAGVVLDYFSKLDTVHCVVETFKSGNSWYRVYDDGWVEQGGYYDAGAVAVSSISLLKSYKDTNYSILITNLYNASGAKHAPHITTVATTGFSYWSENANGDVYWETKGYGA